MKKNRFGGEYYKFVAESGYSLAIINSFSSEGPAVQAITRDGSFQIEDVSKVNVKNDELSFSVAQENLELGGTLRMYDLHPLKHKAMGPFSAFSMECKHEIYSMYHKLDGCITYNGKEISFSKGYGYKEGDYGVNFPEKYIWYNSVGADYGVTLAIATIPFGFINFTGILGFVMIDGKEYDLCTYNGAKLVKKEPECLEIGKGNFKLSVRVLGEGGHMLKAPEQGKMSRYIKENVAVATELEFTDGKKLLLMKRDNMSSLEYMF